MFFGYITYMRRPTWPFGNWNDNTTLSTYVSVTGISHSFALWRESWDRSQHNDYKKTVYWLLYWGGPYCGFQKLGGRVPPCPPGGCATASVFPPLGMTLWKSEWVGIYSTETSRDTQTSLYNIHPACRFGDESFQACYRVFQKKNCASKLIDWLEFFRVIDFKQFVLGLRCLHQNAQKDCLTGR